MAETPKANILLIGTGAVGIVTAYVLESGGRAAVTVVCRSNFAAVQQHGFTIDSIDYGHEIQNFHPTTVRNTVPDVTIEKNTVPFDYIVVTTKNIPDVSPNVLDIITPAITAGHATVVLIQNGLNIEKPIIERFPTNVVLSVTSFISATETAPGVVRHDGEDIALIGPFQSAKGNEAQGLRGDQRARTFLELYTSSRTATSKWSLDPDVTFTRWRKLLYNASYNSVSALLGMDVVRMRMSQTIIDDLVRPIMVEIAAIAKAAAGVHLPEDLFETLIRVDPIDTAFVPSMGQDVAKVRYKSS